MSGKKIAEKKLAYCARLKDYFMTYNKIALITAENVNATQLLHVRHALKDEAKFVFGKNSMMRMVVRQLVESGERPDLLPLIADSTGKIAKGEVKAGMLYNGAGLCFTNGSFGRVKDVIAANCVGSAAKVGAIAPCDVSISPMKTSLPPTQVSVLHALNIQSKIFKGSIEITSGKQLITKGEKVGASEANLLSLLNIQPFQYTLVITHLYDNGNIYSPEILDISDEVLSAKFGQGLKNVAGLSIALGYANKASAQHMVGAAFKDCASIAVALDIKMKQIEELQALLSDPEALAKMQASAAGAGAGGSAAAAPEAKKEEEEVVEMGGFDDLFG